METAKPEKSVFSNQKLKDIKAEISIRIIRGEPLNKELYYLAIAYDLFSIVGAKSIETYENFQHHFFNGKHTIGWIQTSAQANHERSYGFGILPRRISKNELSEEQLNHLVEMHHIPLDEIGTDTEENQ